MFPLDLSMNKCDKSLITFRMVLAQGPCAVSTRTGSYRVEVIVEDYRGQALDFELADSHWLGEVRLNK